ncbi:MAG: DNA polymerase IV [Clostridiaceae bacterium]
MENLTSLIFHIDANSAYLSWQAAYDLSMGKTPIDYRTVPSIVGGSPHSRHGIVLAKSIPAKKFKINTGEPVYLSLKKCPNLLVIPPCFSLYMMCSNAMVEILKEYSPRVQRYSVDECFLDLSSKDNLINDPVVLANKIKDHIKNQLGFTVNIGISTNKLLAKMASDFQKPDKVHTLFPWEIEKKMWPLPVSDLFLVGRATLPKLHKLNIFTIGDLAKFDVTILKYFLKSHGEVIWNFARGIENSMVREQNYLEMKGLGNSTTIEYNVEDKATAYKILLSLTETVAYRLRSSKNLASVVSISLKDYNFNHYSKQKKLTAPTDSTLEIAHIIYTLLDSLWSGVPIRHLGVHLTMLSSNEITQPNLFNFETLEKQKNLDKTLDNLRVKFGKNALVRGVFLHSGIKPSSGGFVEDDYPVMSSLL